MSARRSNRITVKTAPSAAVQKRSLQRHLDLLRAIKHPSVPCPQLPTEMWEHIADFLYKEDVQALACTCRALRMLPNREYVYRTSVNLAECRNSLVQRFAVRTGEVAVVFQACSSYTYSPNVNISSDRPCRLEVFDFKLNHFQPLFVSCFVPLAVDCETLLRLRFDRYPPAPAFSIQRTRAEQRAQRAAARKKRTIQQLLQEEEHNGL